MSNAHNEIEFEISGQEGVEGDNFEDTLAYTVKVNPHESYVSMMIYPKGFEHGAEVLLDVSEGVPRVMFYNDVNGGDVLGEVKLSFQRGMQVTYRDNIPAEDDVISEHNNYLNELRRDYSASRLIEINQDQAKTLTQHRVSKKPKL